MTGRDDAEASGAPDIQTCELCDVPGPLYRQGMCKDCWDELHN